MPISLLTYLQKSSIKYLQPESNSISKELSTRHFLSRPIWTDQQFETNKVIYRLYKLKVKFHMFISLDAENPLTKLTIPA